MALQPESKESTGSQGIIVPGLTRFRLSEKKNRKQFSNSQCPARLEVLVLKEITEKQTLANMGINSSVKLNLGLTNLYCWYNWYFPL